MLAVASGYVQAHLITRFEGQTFAQFVTGLVGRIGAKILLVIFAVFYSLVAVVTLRDFSELMLNHFLLQTPLTVIALVMALLVAYAANSGLEVIARAGQFLTFLILALFFSGILGAANQIKPDNLLPIMEHSVPQLLKSSLIQWAFFCETSIWIMLASYLNQRKKITRVFMGTYAIAGFFTLVVVLEVLATLGPSLAKRSSYPFLTMMELVSFGVIFETVTSFFLVMWVCANFLKMALFFLAGLYGFQEALGIKRKSLLLYPLAIAVHVLSFILFENTLALRMVYWPYVPVWVGVQVGLPIILLTASLIKGKPRTA